MKFVKLSNDNVLYQNDNGIIQRTFLPEAIIYPGVENNSIIIKRDEDIVSFLVADITSVINSMGVSKDTSAYSVNQMITELSTNYFYKSVGSGGGGGGGGATTIADGGNATFGAKDDTSATSDTGSFTYMSLFKRYLFQFSWYLSRFPVSLNPDGGLQVHVNNVSNNEGSAATWSAQSTGNNSLNSIDNKLNSLKSRVPGMFDIVTTPVQTVGNDLYNGLVGDAKAFYLAPKNISASGIIKVSFSMDGTNWSLPVSVQAQIGNIQTQNIAAPNFNEIYKIPVLGAYMRIYVTTAFTVVTDFALKGAYDDRAYDLSTFNTAGNVVVSSGTLTNINSPTTAQGFATAFKLISAATTNSTLVKNSLVSIGTIVVSNASTSAKYLKLYNKATAPTVGTDIPTDTILIPAGQTITIAYSVGKRFTTGLGIAITGAVADADATVVALNDVIVNINYV